MSRLAAPVTLPRILTPAAPRNFYSAKVALCFGNSSNQFCTFLASRIRDPLGIDNYTMIFSDSSSMRIAAYLQVSTDQKSHDSQRNMLEDYCKRRG
jgi:hypothetical protein